MTTDDKIFKHFSTLGKIKLFLNIIALGFALFFLTMFIFGDFDDAISYGLRIFFTLLLVVLFSFGIKNAIKQINIKNNKSQKFTLKSIAELNIYNILLAIFLLLAASASILGTLGNLLNY